MVPKTRRARHVVSTLSLVALSVLAALLWGRLKLVTGIPRTAYAEPETSERAGATPVSPGQNMPPQKRLTSENGDSRPLD